MGQHPSSESINRSGYSDVTTTTPPTPPPPALRQRNGSTTDVIVSEDETMVDVSSASSTVSNRRRTTTLQRNLSISRIIPQRTRTISSSSRPNRRSSLWCRVQSLRNRIYRTTRRINLIDDPIHQTSIPRNPTATRRNTFRDSLVVDPTISNRRRSGIFGT